MINYILIKIFLKKQFSKGFLVNSLNPLFLNSSYLYICKKNIFYTYFSRYLNNLLKIVLDYVYFNDNCYNYKNKFKINYIFNNKLKNKNKTTYLNTVFNNPHSNSFFVFNKTVLKNFFFIKKYNFIMTFFNDFFYLSPNKFNFSDKNIIKKNHYTIFNFFLQLKNNLQVRPLLYINTYNLCRYNWNLESIVKKLNLLEVNFIRINFYNLNKINFFYINFLKISIFTHAFKYNTHLHKSNFLNYNLLLKYIIFLNDFYSLNKNNFNFFSNKYITNLNSNTLNFYSFIKCFKNTNNNSFTIYYNNYYPIFLINSKSVKKLFKNFKNNINSNFIQYTNNFIINFLESFFKSKFFLKITNNFYKKLPHLNKLNSIFSSFRFFQPKYLQKFLISDFLEVLWYSFFLKDLKMLSDLITQILEKISFKFHKKFLTFFQNFVLKYSNVFIDTLKLKGFFFDIRGKVGVSGSSKKRHFFFKIGSLNRSSKNVKIIVNQNLVRTYSGVLGVTYMMSF